MYANSVPALISKNVGNTLTNYKTWGGIIFNVKEYRALGDGITDDTAAINSAIAAAQAAGGGIVFFPLGTYCISQELYVYEMPVSLVGEGSGWYAYQSFVATNISVLKWVGSSGKAMIHYKNINHSYKIEGLKLDCNNSASIGMLLDGACGGMIDNVSILNGMLDCGVRLTSTIVTCSWNTFRNLAIENTKDNTKAIHLTGTVAGGNACHNSFYNTRINHGGANAHAIYLGNSDNNTFHDVFIFTIPGSTGHGVHCDSTELTNFPITNAFYHLQAGAGGWWQDAAVINNVIHFYATDNGQPLPVTNGGTLTYTLMDGTIHPVISLNGRYAKPGNNLGGGGMIATGSTTANIVLTIPEPDGNYGVFLSPANNAGGSMWADLITNAGFTVHIPAALAYALNFSFLIVRL